MIEFKVEMTGLAPKAIKRFAASMPTILKQVYLRAALQAAGEFEKRQLSGRHTARSGLNRITGRTLAAAISASATKAPHEGSGVVAGRVGFIDGHSAMVATMHELGTRGKGGSLPDIVPVRAKWLRFRVSSIVTSAKTGKSRRKWSDFIFTKRVAIPPRLRFKETMRNSVVVHKTKTAAHQALIKAMHKVFGNG